MLLHSKTGLLLQEVMCSPSSFIGRSGNQLTHLRQQQLSDWFQDSGRKQSLFGIQSLQPPLLCHTHTHTTLSDAPCFPLSADASVSNIHQQRWLTGPTRITATLPLSVQVSV
ncbi:hypothetical protein ATANTOWER_029568 [Ataeniobius toweri]|uniref:Uncharacterized protein n=1 Tax=Ataeniobius toweri TaxID=208326 RepID=A0ABU7CAJ9_9TELE|nr:hypothetical protein [Ataeniobius toweri]